MAVKYDVLLVWLSPHNLFAVRSQLAWQVQQALDAHDAGLGDKVSWLIADFCSLRLHYEEAEAARGTDVEEAGG